MAQETWPPKTHPHVELVPIFEDNYVFMVVDPAARSALAIDPGESEAVSKFLKTHELQLQGVLLTHHHADHIGGVRDLISLFPSPIWAPVKNQKQIPFADHYIGEGDEVSVGPYRFSVMELPGHTLGHIAFLEKTQHWLFSGDVLFGLGCGRLFEGTYEQAYESLQRIKNLPNETLVFCTHEYTETNLRFCKMLSRLDDSPLVGDDEELELYANELLNKRALDIPSIPLKLSIEKKVNPFLLAKDVHQFTYLRDLRNMQL